MSEDMSKVSGLDESPAWEDVAACPLCGSNDLIPWRTGCWDSRGSLTRLTYYRCSACDCRPQRPRINLASISRLYGQSYAPYVHVVGEEDLSAVGRGGPPGPLQAKIATIYDREPGGRLLDFGCGTSNFVNAAHTIGWRTVAADFTEAGLAGPREDGHETRLVDDSFDEWLSDQRFDVIRLNHVVEHLYDPAERMATLLASLAEGGVLHIVTPDPRGPATIINRRRCNFFELVHVTLIPPAALVKAADRAGARHAVVVPEQTIKDVWRSWLLTSRRTTSYETAAPEPSNRWVRKAVRVLVALAGRLGRNDRYHAFISM